MQDACRAPRYWITAIVAPVALLLMSFVSIRISGQLAGREVHDGGITISGAMLAAAAIGWVVSVRAIVIAAAVAITTQLSERHRLRTVAMSPLVATAGALSAVIFSGGLNPDMPAPEVFAIGIVGLGVGAVLGWLAAHAILDLDALDSAEQSAGRVGNSGRGADSVGRRRRVPWAGVDQIGSDFTTRSEWQDPTWVGRTDPGYSHILIVLFSFLVTIVPLTITNGGPTLVNTAMMTIIAVAWVIALANLWTRVSIGPSGVLLKSGLFNRPILGVSLGRIERVGVYTPTRSLFDRPWFFRSNRLTVGAHLGRSGLALLVTLSGGFDILLRLDDAEGAAAEIERLTGRYRSDD